VTGTLVTLVVTFLVALGVGFVGVAAVGLVRLPDLYTRAHATSKSDTLGTLLGLAAVAVAFGGGQPTVKTALLFVFVLLTGPTAAHAITRAAYDRGVDGWTRPGTPGGATAQPGSRVQHGHEANRGPQAQPGPDGPNDPDDGG